MSADNELKHLDGVYELNERLVDKQQSLDHARLAPTKHWEGHWELAIVTSNTAARADRTHLIEVMEVLRLAQLREGVWMRPDNLPRELSPLTSAGIRVITASSIPDGPSLVASLWDLDGWSRQAFQLLGGMDTASSPAERFVISAAVIRHLRSDPLLPDELLPNGWPGHNLRKAYDRFESELKELLRTPDERPKLSKELDIQGTPARG